MAALTEAQWVALRAGYTTGTPTKVLAREYDVSPKAIREKATRQNWNRDPEAVARIQAEAAERTAALMVPPMGPPPSPRGGPPYPLARDGGGEAMARDLKALAEDAKADLLTRSNLAGLERISRLKAMFDRYTGLLEDYLQHPGEVLLQTAEIKAQIERATLATALLLTGKDSLAGHVQAVLKMSGEILNQERKALGADDRPKLAEASAPGAGSPALAGGEVTMLGFDPRKMSTSQLQTLYAAIEVMENQSDRPPIPVPPGDPSDDLAEPRVGD